MCWTALQLWWKELGLGKVQRGGFFLRSFPINIPKSKSNVITSDTAEITTFYISLHVNLTSALWEWIIFFFFILQIRSLRSRNVKDLPKVTVLISGRLYTESQIYLPPISNPVPLSPYQRNQGLYIFGSEVKKELRFLLNTNPSQCPVTNKRLTLPRRYTKDNNFQLVWGYALV